jgi:tetratricopeptide (TPR) repeat protein
MRDGGIEMKKLWTGSALIVMVILIFSFSATAGTVAEADALYDQGGLENYGKAIGIYEQLLETSPGDFDLNWKRARAFREYGETAKKQEVEGWKDICKEYGRKGMQSAAKAREIKPDHPAGHYYYGLCVGIYSDGTGILTALKEGLKDKTQSSFEKAYELDKMYEDAGSILALGRFWAVLPWPMASKKKSLAYYREYQKTPYFQQRDEGKIYLAELLIDKGGKDNKAEARQILEQAVKTDDAYFKAWAEQLMTKAQ